MKKKRVGRPLKYANHGPMITIGVRVPKKYRLALTVYKARKGLESCSDALRQLGAEMLYLEGLLKTPFLGRITYRRTDNG
jgi:hypothetical protein